MLELSKNDQDQSESESDPLDYDESRMWARTLLWLNARAIRARCPDDGDNPAGQEQTRHDGIRSHSIIALNSIGEHGSEAQQVGDDARAEPTC